MAIYSINLKNALQTNGIDMLRVFSISEESDHPIKYYEDSTREKSYLGTSLFSPLTIHPGKYTDDKGTEIKFDGMFLDTVLMSVSRNKIIQKTTIAGRKGTIKEYIADGDFSINIKVVIASPAPKIFPEEAVNRFIQILQAPKELDVVCPFLNRHGIDSLVIDSYTNPQKPGFQNVVVFDINASSEIPYEVRVVRD